MSSQSKIAVLISDIFENSFRSYGAPRIQVELGETYNEYVSSPRVAKIMQGKYVSLELLQILITSILLLQNILNQNFKVSRINQVWVSDITYVQTDQGWIYLTVIINLII